MKLLDALMQDLHLDYSARYMCLLQLATGARVGEIMALTYDSLDFKKNTLTINKSWDYKSTHGFKPTKNKENRTIGVDAKTMALLKPYYDEVKKASLKSRFNNPHRLVFVSMNGDPITVDAVNKSLRKACASGPESQQSPVTACGIRMHPSSCCIISICITCRIVWDTSRRSPLHPSMRMCLRRRRNAATNARQKSPAAFIR